MEDFACGELHSMAVCVSGEVYGWGAGEYGQLGNASRYDKNSPDRVKFSETLKVNKISAGKHHTMILTDQGFLYAFGEDNLGQLGLQKKKKIVEIPTFVSYMGHKKVIDLACGTFHTVIMIEPYYVFATGSNKHGQLGIGTSRDKAIFTFVKRLAHKNVLSIFAGDHHSWFILDHDKPRVDDYEMPGPWRFSERSISDDNDFKSRKVGKRERKVPGKEKYNEFTSQNEFSPGQKRKSPRRRKKKKDLDLEDRGGLNSKKRKKKKMNYFDKQGLGTSENFRMMDMQDGLDLEEESPEESWDKRASSDEMEYEEDSQSEDPETQQNLLDEDSPKDKMFETKDLAEKNFYPNKKNNMNVNSRDNNYLDDPRQLKDARNTKSKKSMKMNMFNPNENQSFNDTGKMGDMLGVQNQSNYERQSINMRGDNSMDPIPVNQNNSMRMDSQRNFQVNKNSSGRNMKGHQGSFHQRELQDSSFQGSNQMRPLADSGGKLMMANLHDSNTMLKNVEIEQKPPSDESIDSGEEPMSDTQQNLLGEPQDSREYNLQQMYPESNQKKIQRKRNTVDDPINIKNDLAQNFHLNESGKWLFIVG